MPEATDIQTLNKNIEKIVRILSKGQTSTAQAIADKKKEDENLSLWFDVGKEIKKTTKERKKDQKEIKIKTTNLLGFWGQSAKEYFQNTKKNHETWGGIGKALWDGTKEWFKAASQQNTMLGRTLRLGASMWEATSKLWENTVKRSLGIIGGHIREVLGPVAEAFDFVKGIFMGAFGWMKNVVMSFFRKTPPHAKKRNKLLQWLVNHFRIRDKLDRLEKDPKKKKMPGVLTTILMVAAAVMAAWISKILLPFRLMLKAFKVRPLIQGISNFFKVRFPRFAKFFTKKGALGKLMLGINRVGKIVTGFLTKIPIIGRIVRALKFGFTKLVWPLQILLSVIDFIKGFQATEGNIFAKIKGGMKNVILKFIELPVMFLGWIVEKTAKLFGVELTNVGQSIMDWINKALNAIYKWGPIGWIKSFVDILQGDLSIFDDFGGLLKSVLRGLNLEEYEPLIDLGIDAIKESVLKFFSKIANVFVNIEEWIKKAIKNFIRGDSEGITSEAREFEDDSFPTGEAGAKSISGKLDELNRKIEDLNKGSMENTKKIVDNSTRTANVAMSQMQQIPQPKSDYKQVPDEIDPYGITVQNQSMGMRE